MQVYISLTDWSPLDGIDWWQAHELWNTFANYTDLMEDDRFWSALGRTSLVMAICVPCEFLLGLGLAILFVDNFPGRAVPLFGVAGADDGRACGCLATCSSCCSSRGPVNDILSFFAGSPVTIAWLSDPDLALFAVIVSDVWQWTPLMFLILLA